MNLLTVPREGTGVSRCEIASVYRALVGTFTRATRHVSEACIASSVVHSLYVQVSHEIGSLKGFVCASRVGARMHSVEIGQRRIVGDMMVHVQLFPVCRMEPHVSCEVGFAADDLIAYIAIHGGLNRMDE